MKREDVYNLIEGERNYQDSLWNESTTTSKGIHSVEEWFYYIEKYIRDANIVLTSEARQVSNPKAMCIMRKVAALAVHAMEQHQTMSREEELDKKGV